MKTSSVIEKRFEEQEKRAARFRWLAFMLVTMAIFLDTLNISTVNTALPTIKIDLQLTTTELQWIPGVYILIYAGFVMMGGRAADLLGRRRIFLFGVTCFGLASLADGLAQSGWLLILARGVQGFGAALMVPAATSIITTSFPEGRERNKALGILFATGGVGFASGLALGGVLTTFISWHWVFFVNVPIILLILLLSRVAVREDRREAGPRSYDLAGASTVTAGLLLLVYAMTQANGAGATPLKTAGLVVLALVLLVIFLLVEWRSKAPLMPFHIFRSSTLGAACGVSFIMMGAFFSFMFICTLYLQNVLHFSPLDASLGLLPAGIASIPVSQFVTPWCMNRLGTKFTAGLGMLGLLSGIMLFLRTGVTSDYVGIILPATLLTISCGSALCVPTLVAAAVKGIQQTEQGLASGLQAMSAQAGGGLFLALTATVITVSTNAAQGSAQASAPSVAAQLSGFHTGLLVIAASVALGVLIALVGIRSRPATQSDAPDKELR